jgi:hypothetical protein
MVAHTPSANTWEAEAEGPLVQGQPGLYSTTQSQKRKKKNLQAS